MKRQKREACDYGFPNPEFTKEMKDTHVILTPDIFPTHMELLASVFRMYGYRLEICRDDGKSAIDLGLRSVHNDMCYPVICITGQMLHALTSGRYDPHKCALIMFQTGGGCRASNYIWMERKALHRMGFDDVPVISLSFTGMEKQSGFHITPMMAAKGIVAVLYGDMLMLLRNQVKPYEKNAGETQKTVEKWYGLLTEQFRKNRGLFGKQFRRNLHDMAADFAAIERLNVKKTKVGIVGEIYVKYSAFGNNGLEAFLESQDCEFMVPGVLGFIQFMFDNKKLDHDLYGVGKKNLPVAYFGRFLTERIEKTFIKVLKDFPQFAAPASFSNIRRLADEIIGRGVKMGEGWLLPAEMAELIEKGYDNIVCVQPFGCLPNHIIAKGTVRTIREMYPHANICPVDYDSGASKVNQENRIKLMLALAREGAEA